MDKNLKEKILYEMSCITTLLEQTGILIQKCKLQAPDFIELNAAGSTLHSYYNGLENIFLLINKNIDGTRLSGTRWHRDLLESMFSASENRSAVLDKSLYDELFDYMSFRHVFRHSYSYALDWERLSPLFCRRTENWQSVRRCLQDFITKDEIP